MWTVLHMFRRSVVPPLSGFKSFRRTQASRTTHSCTESRVQLPHSAFIVVSSGWLLVLVLGYPLAYSAPCGLVPFQRISCHLLSYSTLGNLGYKCYETSSVRCIVYLY
jgi:hypothetical protein